MTHVPGCQSPPGLSGATRNCEACGAVAGEPCLRKTQTERHAAQTGQIAKVGLAKGRMSK